MSVTIAAQICETISVKEVFKALEIFKTEEPFEEQIDLYDSNKNFIKTDKVIKNKIYYFFPNSNKKYSEHDIIYHFEKNDIDINEYDEFQYVIIRVGNHEDIYYKDISTEIFNISKIKKILSDFEIFDLEPKVKLKLYYN